MGHGHGFGEGGIELGKLFRCRRNSDLRCADNGRLPPFLEQIEAGEQIGYLDEQQSFRFLLGHQNTSMVGFRLKVKPKLPPLIQQVLEKRFVWFAGHGQLLSLSSSSKMSRPESSSPPACLDRLLCITRAATRWSRRVNGFSMQMSPSLLRNGGSQLRSVATSVE